MKKREKTMKHFEKQRKNNEKLCKGEEARMKHDEKERNNNEQL